MVSRNQGNPAVKSFEQMQVMFRELAATCDHLPAGDYTARLECMTYVPGAKPSFLLQFNVIGPRTEMDKKAYRRLWVTEKAIRWTQQDLAKIGIHDISEIENVQTFDLLCSISVDDSPSESRVVHFDVLSDR